MSYAIESTKGVEAFLKTLDLRTVTQVYNGRVGCCCGCLGTHTKLDTSTESGLSKARRKVKHMLKLLSLIAQDPEGEWSDWSVGVSPGDHVFVERNNRTNIVYFKPREGAVFVGS